MRYTLDRSKITQDLAAMRQASKPGELIMVGKGTTDAAALAEADKALKSTDYRFGWIKGHSQGLLLGIALGLAAGLVIHALISN